MAIHPTAPLSAGKCHVWLIFHRNYCHQRFDDWKNTVTVPMPMQVRRPYHEAISIGTASIWISSSHPHPVESNFRIESSIKWIQFSLSRSQHEMESLEKSISQKLNFPHQIVKSVTKSMPGGEQWRKTKTCRHFMSNFAIKIVSTPMGIPAKM